jgi:hypothetical protein
MSNSLDQKSFPFISPIKPNSKHLNEPLYKTPIKANSFCIDKHPKHQTIPYSLSTTEQSSFISGMHNHNKHNNSLLSSPYKHLTSIRYKMYSKLQSLEEKEKQNASLSNEQSKSQKQLMNKFIESRRNVSLIKPPYEDSNKCLNENKKNVDFRKNLIRDYTGENRFANFEQKINRAKEYYYKQVDLIQRSQKTKQKELNKIIEELEARKVNNLITNISLIKETFREDINNKHKKPIDYNKLENIAMNSLKMYFNKKMKLKKDIAKQITNEIQNMDAKPYEKLFNKRGVPLKQGQMFNECNLERKIKLHNITHSRFDPYNDDLCEKNPEMLKHNMSSINLGIAKYIKGHCPRNVKKTFKNATLGKYAGLNGVYFSMS